MNVFFLGMVVFLFIGFVWNLVTSIYWPKFERDRLARDEFLHIVPSPDRWKKP